MNPMSGQPVASYPILAKIRIGSVDTSGLDTKIDVSQRKAEAFGAAMLGIAGKITAATLAAAALVATGIGFAVKIGAEMESAESGIASVLMAMEGIDAIAAKPVAKTLIAQLNDDAARGVGTLENYVETFQSIYASARQSGAKIDEIRNLTKLAIGAGFALQGQRGLINAPLDIQQALTAGVSDRTTPIALAALRASGTSEDAFRKMGGREKLDALMKGFGTFGPAIEVMGRTFEAQSATFEDNLKRHARTLSAPIFEAARSALVGVNDRLAENDAKLANFANALAEGSEYVGKFVTWFAEFGADAVIGAANATPEIEALQRAAKKLEDDSTKAGEGLGLVEGATRIATTGLSALALILSDPRNWLPWNGAAYAQQLGAGYRQESDRSAAFRGSIDPAFTGPFGVEANGSAFYDPATQGLPDYALVGNVDSMLLVDQATASLDKVAKAMTESAKKEKKVKIDLTMPPIQWGNDRSMRVALGGLLEEVATRAYNLSLDSVEGVDR